MIEMFLRSNQKDNLRILKESNADVARYFSKISPQAKKVYDKLVKAYDKGHVYYVWWHGDSIQPRGYHLKRDGKIFRIRDAIELKTEFPKFMPNCSCNIEII
jgi:hypothetical protein